jgi:hypothetical protein
VSLNLKFRVAVLFFVAGLLAGCGGIRASKSVSPATFLIPGFMKAEPEPEKTNDLPVIHHTHRDSSPS